MSLFIIDLLSTEIHQDELPLLTNPYTAGVLLFSRNFVDPAQFNALLSAILAINPHLIFFVDQEGGNVQRFQRRPFRSIPAPRVYGECYDESPELGLLMAKKWGRIMAQDLLQCGVHLSFAPILDLHVDNNPIIAELDRAFHRDPSVVTRVGGAFIEGMHETGMRTIGKHFPGHGSTTTDSHLMKSYCLHPLEQLNHQDLYPFKQLIAQGALDAVMMAHVIYPAIDAENPATYSKKWFNVLRQELGFEGVAISDCLGMTGADIGDLLTRVRVAQDAGCELLIVANQAREVLRTLFQERFILAPASLLRVQQFIQKAQQSIPHFPHLPPQATQRKPCFSGSAINNTRQV